MPTIKNCGNCLFLERRLRMLKHNEITDYVINTCIIHDEVVQEDSSCTQYLVDTQIIIDKLEKI